MLLPPLAAPAAAEAVRLPDGALTFGELRDAAAALAATLPAGERVALWATPELATVVGVVGALAAGTPVVTLNPKSGPQELAHILADARPAAVVASPSAQLPEALAGVPRAAAATSGRAAPWPDEPPGDAPALVMYTSGTTGPPKGVVLSRDAIGHNLDALADAWAWTADDVLVHALPLFHVHGLVIGTLGPLRLGGRVRHLGALHPNGVAAQPGAGATLPFGVPTMYHRLAAVAEAEPAVADALRGARLLVSGSAALAAADHDRLQRACGQRIV